MKNITEQFLDILNEYIEKVCNGNRSMAARNFNLSPMTVHQWLTKTRSPNLSVIEQLCDKLKIHMVCDIQDWQAPQIVKYKRRIGGGSILSDNTEIEKTYEVDKNFFTKNHIDKNNNFAAEIESDSFSPIWRNGDTVVIATNEKNLIDGAYFLFDIQGAWVIRQVKMGLSGLSLTSPNPEVPDMNLTQEEIPQLKIIGRICYTWKRV